MIFSTPQAFLLLVLLIPAVILIIRGRSGKPAVRYSNLYQLKLRRRTVRQRLLFLPPLLYIAAAVMLVAALARPQQRLDESRKVTSGVAMQLVIDRSGSMAAEIENGRRLDRRIDIVKRNILTFIDGEQDGPGGPGGRSDDLIGLIAFARYADTLAPLSLSHSVLTDFVKQLDVVTDKSRDGTSIGDALALAAARLRTSAGKGDAGKGEAGYTIKSKLIILLTDGENNAGKYSPREAAEMAADWGIKVYTIGFGGTAYFEMKGLFGSRRLPVGSAVDEQTLKAIADMTGGRYFSADSPEELSAVYAAIDELEKSEIVSFDEYEYRELFIYFAAAAVFLIMAAFLLESSILRRLP